MKKVRILGEYSIILTLPGKEELAAAEKGWDFLTNNGRMC